MSATQRFHQVANDALVSISEQLWPDAKLCLTIYTEGKPGLDIVLKDQGTSLDEVLSTLRRGGMSIDGDNAYKRDLLSTVNTAQPDVSGLVEALEGMLEYFPEGHSDGECFSVEAAKAALAAYRAQRPIMQARAVSDDDMPGMWSTSDLSGGETDANLAVTERTAQSDETAASQAVDAEINSLTAELDKLRVENDQIRAENGGMQMEIDELREALKDQQQAAQRPALEGAEPAGWEWTEVFLGGSFDGDEANNGFYRGAQKETIRPTIVGTEIRQRPLFAIREQTFGQAHVNLSERQGGEKTAAAQDVLAERQRQISVEDFDASRDNMATRGQIAMAAGLYAIDAAQLAAGKASLSHPSIFWPWPELWWKPSTPRRNLVKAGALILAEIERLDRAALADAQQGDGGAA